MNRTISASLLLTLLVGCQSVQSQRQPIPQDLLTSLSTKWVVVESCHSINAYSTDQAVNYREAVNYAFSTWSVLQADIEKAVLEKRDAMAAYRLNSNSLGVICKNWQLTLETDVRDARNHKEQVAINRQRAHEVNKAMASQPVTYNNSNLNGNTIQCTRISDLSFNKNIQTFNGMICPLGWMKYYGW